MCVCVWVCVCVPLQRCSRRVPARLVQPDPDCPPGSTPDSRIGVSPQPSQGDTCTPRACVWLHLRDVVGRLANAGLRAMSRRTAGTCPGVPALPHVFVPRRAPAFPPSLTFSLCLSVPRTCCRSRASRRRPSKGALQGLKAEVLMPC